jgi:hypothetical protein
MSGIFDQIINYSPPLIVSGTVNYKGTWNASTNNPTLNSSPAASTKGDYYVVSTAGTQFGITFAIGDWIISNGTAWEKVDLTDAVSSVFGRTGAVVGVSTDYSAVGLTNTAIGASNPSTGAFTSLSSSSTTTLNGTTIPTSSTLLVSGGALGTPSSGTLSSCTGLPISTGVSGLGTGIATALAINTGTTGAPALLGSAGAFTTLSASGGITNTQASTASINNVATGASSTSRYFASAPTTGTGYLLFTDTTLASNRGYIGYTFATDALDIATAGVVRGAFSSTGLAVTGALSSTGGLSTTGNNTFTEPTLGTTSAYLGMSTTGAYFGTAAAKPVYFETNGTERVRIDSSGNVGIGVTPTQRLDIATASGDCIIRLGNGTSTARFAVDNDGPYIYALTAGDNSLKVFTPAGGTAMLIDSTGNVGIGTTSPDSILTFVGNITSKSSDNYGIGTNGGNNHFNVFATGASGAVRFWTGGSSATGTGGGGTERARIDSSGNLGVGTSSPSVKLHVQSASAGATALRLTDAVRGTINIDFPATSQIRFDVGAAEKTLFSSGGNTYLTINDANSGGGVAVTGTLSATSNITTSGTLFSNFANSFGALGLELKDTTDTSGATFAAFRKANGTAIGSITRVTTTDAVVYNTTSDARLKENLRDFTDSGRLIDSLKPRVFDWKNSDENGKNVVGFIAQEEHAADPMFAHIGAVSVGDEDPETITKQWQRSDSALIPILVAELKNVRQRLAALEA